MAGAGESDHPTKQQQAGQSLENKQVFTDDSGVLNCPGIGINKAKRKLKAASFQGWVCQTDKYTVGRMT